MTGAMWQSNVLRATNAVCRIYICMYRYWVVKIFIDIDIDIIYG